MAEENQDMAVSAREMSQRSMEAVGRGDKQEWLSLFADDAFVEDPVGPSFFDPEGRGHHGRDGIANFFDIAIAPNKSITFEIRESHQCADEVANVGTITITLGNGQVGRVNGVFIYKVDGAGKIASLRAFWEQDSIAFGDA